MQPRRSAIMALAGVLTVLTACAGGEPTPNWADYDYRHRHPVGVDRALASLAVDLPAGAAGIPSPDLDRLQRFAADYETRGQGAVDVLVTAPTQAGASESARLLASELSKLGISPDRINLRLDGGGAAMQTTAVMSYRQHVARLPECGDWSDRADMNYTNTTSRNFGCSIQRNLGLMVADPRDLERARAREAGEAGRAVDVVNRYRRGEATPSAGAVEATSMGGSSGTQ